MAEPEEFDVAGATYMAVYAPQQWDIGAIETNAGASQLPEEFDIGGSPEYWALYPPEANDIGAIERGGTGDNNPTEFDIAGATYYAVFPPEPRDIGAHEKGGTGDNNPTEFDIAGATYFAVAPAGYIYNGTQDTNYSTRKYNTLSAAIAALNTTPSNEEQVINIIGDWTSVTDTTRANLTGITQGSVSDKIYIRAIGDARHDGVWVASASTTHYRLTLDAANGILAVNQDFVEVDGIILEYGTASTFDRPVLKIYDSGASSEGIFKNLIIKGHNSGTHRQHGVDADGASTSQNYFINCIIYDVPRLSLGHGMELNGSNAYYYLYNCTIIGGDHCIFEQENTRVYAKNIYVGNALNDDIDFYSSNTSFTGKFKYVASSDTTGNTDLQNIPYSTATFTNVTGGSENFIPAVGSSLIDAGRAHEDESAPLNFAYDIAGFDTPLYSFTGTQDTNYGSRKYNTLSAAEAALNTAPSNEEQVINIIGDWTNDTDTTRAAFAGVTQGSIADKIYVRAIGDARHDGVYSDSSTFYRISNGSTSGTVYSSQDFIEFDGFIIDSPDTVTAGTWVLLEIAGTTTSVERTVKNMILKGHNSGTYAQRGIELDAGGSTNNYIFNCIIFNFGTAFGHYPIFVDGSSGSNHYIYNTTIIGGYYGLYDFTSLQNIYVKNCYVGGSGNGDYNESSSGFDQFESSASSDTTSPNTSLQNIAVDATTFTNVTSGSEDYTPAVNSPLIDAGSSNEGEDAPLNFTSDIAGKNKPSTTFTAEQNTNYGSRKYVRLSQIRDALVGVTLTSPTIVNIIGDWSGRYDPSRSNFSLTADPTNYLLIRAIGTARHNGVWSENSTFYRHKTRFDSILGCLSISNNMTVDGFIVEKEMAKGNDREYITASSTGADVNIKNMIVKGLGSSNGGGTYRAHGIEVGGNSAGDNVNIINCLVYDMQDGGQLASDAILTGGGTNHIMNIRSCTAIGWRHGIRDGSSFGHTFTIRNCYGATENLGGSSRGFIQYSGDSFDTFTTCASNDNESGTSAGLRNILHTSTSVFTNVTAGSEDFTPALGSVLIDAGREFTSDGGDLAFDYDLKGNTRPPTTWTSEQDTNYSSRKYLTLNEALNALPATLTTPYVINIIGNWLYYWDSGYANISGKTTTAANYLSVRTIGEARHKGAIWGKGAHDDTDPVFHTIRAGSSANGNLALFMAYMRVDGLAIIKTNNTGNSRPVVYATATDGEQWISNCIVRGSAGHNNSYREWGIRCITNGSSGKSYIWNCLIYDLSTNSTFYQSEGIELDGNNASAEQYVYSCTVDSSDGRYGIRNESDANTVEIRNCYICVTTQVASECLRVEGTTNSLVEAVATSDDDAPDAGLRNIPRDATTFTDPANADYTVPVSSPLYNMGTDTSSEPTPLDFTDNIADDARK